MQMRQVAAEDRLLEERRPRRADTGEPDGQETIAHADVVAGRIEPGDDEALVGRVLIRGIHGHHPVEAL